MKKIFEHQAKFPPLATIGVWSSMQVCFEQTDSDVEFHFIRIFIDL